MSTRHIAAALLVVVGAAGCQDGGTKGPEARPVTDEPSEIEVHQVAVDPTGGGWVLGRSEPDTWSLHHVDEDGTVEPVTLVPEGSYFSLLGLPDGRLALAGARCDDDCRSTVTEVLFIDRAGDIAASEAVARTEGNLLADPEYSPDIGIVGEVGGDLWVRARSELREVRPNGDLQRAVDVDGVACVIDGDVYELHVVPRDQTTVDTTDPVRPDHYTVSRLEASGFEAVDELDAAPDSFGQGCAGDAFEVNEGMDRRQYWEPDGGWTVGEWVDDPSPAGAMAEYTLDGYVLVVDADGTVMVRRHGGWVDLPLRHDLDPALGRQLHAADLSRGALLSCIGPPPHPLLLADLTCRFATSVAR